MTTTAPAHKGFANYHHFARMALDEDVQPPEPMSARERGRLSSASLEERRVREVDYVSNLLVLSPQQEAMIRQFDIQMAMLRSARPGAQEPLYVQGPSGTGKSTALQQAAFRLHRRVLEQHNQAGRTDPVTRSPGWSHDLIPVIWITVRSEASGKAVVGQIRSFLMEGEPRGAGWQITNELPKVLPRHGVALIVLDDVHNLGTRGKEAEAVLKTIKNLETDLGLHRIGFVYVGNPDPDSGEYNLTLHDQLSQRMLEVKVDHFELDVRSDTAAQNEIWVDHLLRWEEVLVHVLPDLQRGDLASKAGLALWKRVHGSPGGLYKVLKRYTVDSLWSEPGRTLGIQRERLLTTPLPAKYEALAKKLEVTR